MNTRVSALTHDIVYRFRFPGGELKEFKLSLERPTLGMVKSVSDAPLPVWTELGYHQCSNCPLRADSHPRCPIAVNVVDVIDAFSDVASHEESDVEAITPARTYSVRAKSTLAIGSLIGIYMVTSGCPILDKLRPMVLTHLPFATTEESVYRAISMYLLAQYIRNKKGLKSDWDLKEFAAFYDEVQLVNQSFVKRLTAGVERDASLNAVVLLNCFGSATRRMITQEKFHEIEPMFYAYFAGDGDRG